MATPEFGLIQPAPASDWFEFDLTDQIGDISPGAVVFAVTWACAVSPDSSSTEDTTPEDRILDTKFSDHKVAVFFGNGVDGVEYELTATVTLYTIR